MRKPWILSIVFFIMLICASNSTATGIDKNFYLFEMGDATVTHFLKNQHGEVVKIFYSFDFNQPQSRENFDKIFSEAIDRLKREGWLKADPFFYSGKLDYIVNLTKAEEDRYKKHQVIGFYVSYLKHGDIFKHGETSIVDAMRIVKAKKERNDDFNNTFWTNIPQR